MGIEMKTMVCFEILRGVGRFEALFLRLRVKEYHSMAWPGPASTHDRQWVRWVTS